MTKKERMCIYLSKCSGYQLSNYYQLKGYNADQLRIIAYYNYMWDNEEYTSKYELIKIILDKLEEGCELLLPEDIEGVKYSHHLKLSRRKLLQ